MLAKPHAYYSCHFHYIPDEEHMNVISIIITKARESIYSRYTNMCTYTQLHPLSKKRNQSIILSHNKNIDINSILQQGASLFILHKSLEPGFYSHISAFVSACVHSAILAHLYFQLKATWIRSAGLLSDLVHI